MKKTLNSISISCLISNKGRQYAEDDYQFPYSRSFQAKLIQSTDEVKDLYSVLKNKIMSFKKITNHFSWNHESFNIGRNQIFKFKVKGKSLYLLMKKNPSDHEKFAGEYTTNKKYAKTPFIYRVNGDRRSIYALELIDMLAREEGLQLNKKFIEVNYVADLAYQSTEKLIFKGLIKENGLSFIPYKEVTEVEAEQAITNELAKQLIDEKKTGVVVSNSQLVPVNIGQLEQSFSNGDVVNLESLKEKKIVSKNAKGIKLLAGGKLTKALKVEANQCSLSAVKMIILVGGDITKVD